MRGQAPRLIAAVLAAFCVVAVGWAPSPAWSRATPAFAFPTHVRYGVGVMPSASQAARDSLVRQLYDSWKPKYLVPGCAAGQYYVSTVGDGDAPHDGTVSEAQGYGMVIVALMAGYDQNAKAEFDGAWALVKAHRDSYGMMAWQLDGRTCKYADSGAPDGATDGDLDIGYALILADRQWGGYTAAAKDWLSKFYAADVAPDGHLKVADDVDDNATRPSDGMLDHLRAFASYDPAHDWRRVVARTEAVFSQFSAAYSAGTGLLSDFIVAADTDHPKPAPATYMENQPDNIVGYNSVRVPWRLGTDALLYGGAVARSLAAKESAALKKQSQGNPLHIFPHTNLDGTARRTDGDGNADTESEAAGDPVGPAAMVAGDQAFTDALWAQLARNPFGEGYFGETIKMQVAIVMAGDYWSPISKPVRVNSAPAKSVAPPSSAPATSSAPPEPTALESDPDVAAPYSLPPAAVADRSPSHLPLTGSNLFWLAGTGLVAIGTGAMALLVARRRRET